MFSIAQKYLPRNKKIIYEKKIIKIKIFLMTGNSAIARAIEARVNLLASKKLKEKEAGRIEHETYKATKPKNKKRKWSYSPVKKTDHRNVDKASKKIVKEITSN